MLSLRTIDKYADSAIVAYSGMQAFAAQIQRLRPGYASTIYKIQKIMTVVDGIEIVGNSIRTYFAYKERYGLSDDRIEWKPLIVMGISAIGLGMIAYQIHRILRPGLPLKNLMLPANSSLTFSTTFTQVLIQWFLLMRISLNIGLAILSEGKGFKVFSASFQALSLFNISKLKWLRLKRSYDTPLKGVPFTANTNIPHYSSLIRRVDTNLYFMVPHAAWSLSNCPSTAKHYEKAAQQIVESSKHLFVNSQWGTYTRTRTEYNSKGIYRVIPELVTTVKAVAPRFENCLCGCTPKLTDWSIKIHDAFLLSTKRRVSHLSFK